VLARSPERFKEIALSYGPLAAVAWGIVMTLQAFYSPQNTEWADWCVRLIGGMAIAVTVPIALALAAGWIAGRRNRRSPA
jgi:membrane protein DedA with SNARE-associated domain